MCQGLRALRDSIKSYAGAFDAAALTPAEADVVVDLCAQIEASISSVKALAAARSAESGTWKEEGYRSPADRLAHRTGVSPGTARRAIDTGRRMAVQPEVSRAARAGELSAEQATAVSDAVAVDPALAKDLVRKAGQLSVPELNAEVARAKAVAEDEEGRRQRIRAKRSFRWWADRDGALQGHLYGPLTDGMDLTRMLDPIRRRLHQMHRDAGRPPEPFEALDYDALRVLTAVAIGRECEVPPAQLLELGLFPGLAGVGVGAAAGEVAVEGGASPVGAGGGAGLARASGASGSTSAGGGSGSAGGGRRASSAGAGGGAGGSPPGAPIRLPDLPPPPLPGQGDLVAPLPADPPVPQVAGVPPAAEARKGKKGRRLAGRPTQIMIRVDLDTLLRGRPLDGELCEIAGVGPIPVSAVKDILASDNPFLIAIITRGRDIVGVAHKGRQPTAHQRSALDFIHPTCAAAGCNTRVGLDYDHREDWAKTKYTLYDQLDRLCRHCHGLKTQRNWALVPGRGKRDLVPPTDPRHPGYRGRAPDDA